MKLATLFQPFKDKLQHPRIAFTISLSMGQNGKKQTGNNTALQGQEVQSLDISGTCFHPHSLYPSFYLLFQTRGSKPWDGWAERCKGFQKRTESDCCSTWGAKTKEPSLPVGLWESGLWSGPERESSLMKYWCFFFNCVLWELSLLSGCVRWSTILLCASLDENGLDYAAQGVLSALMGLMMTPHSGPELVRDLIKRRGTFNQSTPIAKYTHKWCVSDNIFTRSWQQSLHMT